MDKNWFRWKFEGEIHNAWGCILLTAAVVLLLLIRLFGPAVVALFR